VGQTEAPDRYISGFIMQQPERVSRRIVAAKICPGGASSGCG
jgi:hypothetical protein